VSANGRRASARTPPRRGRDTRAAGGVPPSGVRRDSGRLDRRCLQGKRSAQPALAPAALRGQTKEIGISPQSSRAAAKIPVFLV
jgi:hypothetical protein